MEIDKNDDSKGFSEETVWMVWSKALVIALSDAPVWRKDECGAWINRADYRNKNSLYGWEIEHIIPNSQGGTNNISNLIPLQWENNVRRQDGSLECPVRASGTENIKRTNPES